MKFDVMMIIMNHSDNDDDINVILYDAMMITTDIWLGGILWIWFYG